MKIAERRFLRCWMWLLCVSCGLCFPALGRAADQRFQAVFQDGTRVTGDELRNWHDTDATPTLSDRPVLDAANPAIWIRDVLAPAAAPVEQFVEFFGGDLLPGKVVAWRSGRDSPAENQLPFLVVESDTGWDLPSLPSRLGELRVLTSSIRRVVWERRADPTYRPGTLFFRDGRRLEFRAARWGHRSVITLAGQQTTETSFDEIAELHLPLVPAWEAYLDAVSILSPDCSSRLLQIESVDGLRLTASQERFQAVAQGNRNDPNSWYHLFQPAWSLEPFWVWHRKIAVRRLWEPHEPPLTVFDPVQTRQASSFAASWNWQRNRNVYGGLLESGGNVYGGGYGVQAQQELEFVLPSPIQGLRVQIGLDRSVGRGGCARGKILLDGNPGQPLFASELLIGTESVVDTGLLTWEPLADRPRSITLVADAAHADRPAGSDPFNIRDIVNWLDPHVIADRQRVADAVRQRGSRWLAPWQGWQLEAAAAYPVQLSNRWDSIRPQDPRFVLDVGARLPFLTWSRKLTVKPEQSWLVIAAHRGRERGPPTQLQVLINGRLLREVEVPEQNSPAEPPPLIVSLHEYQGEQIDLAVTQLPGGPNSRVRWKSVLLTSSSPGTQSLFEDDPDFVKQVARGNENLLVERRDVFSGTASIRAEAGAEGNPRLSGLAVPIREYPQLGEFRYVSFAWKKPTGSHICWEFAVDGKWGSRDGADARHSYRFDAGHGDRAFGNAIRIDGRAPAEWTVVTHDLFATFGECTVTGVAFQSVDGEPALFDQFFFARTKEDLAVAPVPRVQPLALFEDQFEILRTLEPGNGRSELDAEEVFSGSRSVRITPDQKYRVTLYAEGLQIRQNPGPTEYRYLRFAWKKRGGDSILLQLANRGAWGPIRDPSKSLRYQAGPGKNIYDVDALLLGEELPEDWVVVTRDLYADFGEFSLTGLALCPQNGEAGWFDHIYLARRMEDFDRLGPLRRDGESQGPALSDE